MGQKDTTTTYIYPFPGRNIIDLDVAAAEGYDTSNSERHTVHTPPEQDTKLDKTQHEPIDRETQVTVCSSFK